MDTGASGKGKGAGDKGRDTRHRQGGGRERAHRGQRPGTGREPRGKERKGDVGYRGQAGLGTETGGEGKGRGQGKGAAKPQSRKSG